MATQQTNIAELVEQLPATDRELDALKAQQQPAQPEQPGQPKRRQRPPPPGGGSTFTGPDPETADKLCEQVLAGGRASLLELLGLVCDPGDPEFKDYKAAYLVHCLVTYVARPGKGGARNLLRDTLAAQLGNEGVSKAVRTFFVRELQWVGDRSVAAPLAKLLDDELLCQPAVAALVAIGGDVADFLRPAVATAKGRNRLCLLQNLGVLRDKESSALFRQALDDEDREVRLAAAWGLANLGDAGSIDLLLKAASTEANYERIKCTQACLLLAEKLAAGRKAREAARIYTHLRDTRTDKAEKYIRDLADKALAQS